MNNNRQFDEHIKEQFGNYSPGVHPRIWENIIAQKERRKPVGFWINFFSNKSKLLLFSLLLIVSTGGALLYINHNTPLTTSGLSDEKAAERNNRTKDINNEGGLNAVKNSSTAPENSTALNEVPGTGSTNTSLNSGSSLSIPGGSNVHIYTPSIQKDEEENTATQSSAGSKKRKKTDPGLLNINMESPGLDNDEDYAMQGTLLGRLTFNAQRISAKQKKNKESSVSFNPVIFLPDCPSIEKNASGNKKYLEIYAGPDYAFRSLSDTGNSEYLKRRKESTKFSSAYSAGIRYTKVFNNSMSVRAGVNYSQINEKFKFSQGNLVQITYIIGPNGDTLGSYTTTGTRYKTTINKYRSVDVPVVVGYEIGNGKWHANINAGVVVNIYSWQKGDVLDTAYQPVNITTGKNSSPYQFKTNAGVGFTGGVSVYYKLNDRLHLMAEPYFRYNFSPISKENITLKQKYQTAGIRLGIRLDLK